jgi:hypothetical protein
MQWIDNASEFELHNPPREVRDELACDRECMRYYEVSLKLMLPEAKVDLWNKFRMTITGTEKRESRGFFKTRWIWSLSTAGAALAIVIVLLLSPFNGRQKSEFNTEELDYYDSVDLIFEISSDFGIASQYEMGALDYYYVITTF